MFQNSLAYQLLKSFVAVFSGTLGFFFALGFGMFILVLSFAAIGALIGDDTTVDRAPEYTYHAGDPDSDQKILSIPVEGVILGEPSENDWTAWLSGTGVSYGYTIKEKLQAAAERDDIDGVILEFHTPGGTIFGSKAIADGIAAYRQSTSKPIYAFVGSMAASGGYWAAAASDTILADAGTSIGSIGVIYGPFKYYDGVISEDGGAFLGGVVTQNGIESQYITAGTSKDLGNPYRRLTEREIAVLQSDVNNAYDQFVSFVAANRKISENYIRSNIGALIYDEVQAKDFGLIDDTANRDQAYQAVATAAKLKDFQIVRQLQDASFWSQIMMAVTKPQLPQAQSTVCPFTSSVLALSGTTTQWCR